MARAESIWEGHEDRLATLEAAASGGVQESDSHAQRIGELEEKVKRLEKAITSQLGARLT